MTDLPKPICVRLKMKPSANKRGVLVDHEDQQLRCSFIHFTTLAGGLSAAAEDIESIEILPHEPSKTTDTA